MCNINFSELKVVYKYTHQFIDDSMFPTCYVEIEKNLHLNLSIFELLKITKYSSSDVSNSFEC